MGPAPLDLGVGRSGPGAVQGPDFSFLYIAEALDKMIEVGVRLFDR